MHRWLDAAGQQPSYRPVSPFACVLSRLCEEFPGRLPSEIMAEMDRLPCGLLEEIVASRAYMRACAANQSDPKTAGNSEMRQLAMQIEGELAQEEIEAARG